MARQTGLVKRDGGFLTLGPIEEKGELIPGLVYDLVDRVITDNREIVLEPSSLKLPSKDLCDIRSKSLRKRIVISHKSTDGNHKTKSGQPIGLRNTTGVLLHGIKGSGKTVDANTIATMSKLTVINVITQEVSYSDLDRLLKYSGLNDVCIIIDEFDKREYKNGFIEFLDGSQQSCRKLVILTANSIKDLDKNLQNRTSRILYVEKYEKVSDQLIPNLLEEFGIKDEDKTFQAFIEENFDLQTIDLIKSVIQECIVFGPKDQIYTTNLLHKIVAQMNISLKGQRKFRDAGFKSKGGTEDHLNEILNLISGVDDAYEKSTAIQNLRSLKAILTENNQTTNSGYDNDDEDYDDYDEFWDEDFDEFNPY